MLLSQVNFKIQLYYILYLISYMLNNKFQSTDYYLKKAKKILTSDVTGEMLQKFEYKEERVQDLIRQLRKTEKKENSKSNKEKQLTKLSKFVQDKNNAVKYYIKQKYQSGFFQQYTTDQSNSNAIKLLEQDSIQLNSNLIAAQQQKINVKKQIVASLKNFQEHKINKLPITQINHECFLYPDYLDIDTKSIQIKSNSSFNNQNIELNVIDLSTEIINHVPQESLKLDTVIQTIQQQQCEELLLQKKHELKNKYIKKIMTENKNIYLIFYEFFKSIIKQEEGFKGEIKNKITNNSDKKIQGIIYQEDAIQESKKPDHSKIFRQSKNMIDNYEPIPQKIPANYIPKDDLVFQTQKIANKRNGDTLLYHPKSFLLNGSTLFYHDTNDQNLKKITLFIQKLELIQFQKEFGGFFSRQKKKTKIFVVKGKERSLQIEYSQRQGAQIFEQLIQYMAIKAYCNYCIFFLKNENLFSQFIYSKECKNLNLEKIRIENQAQQIDNKQLMWYMQIWLNLLKYRKQIKRISLKNSQMDDKLIEYILQKIVDSQLKIQYLNISQNKINLESVKLYSHCLETFTNILILDLSYCGLNDQFVKQGLRELPNYVSRLKLLNLSGNNITNITGYFLSGLCKKFVQIQLKLNKCLLGFECLLTFLNQQYQIISLQMNDCKLILDNDLLINLADKLSLNRNLKKLSLLSNECNCDYEVIKNLFKYSNYLQQIAFDMPREFMYEYADDQNINEWGIDGEFVKNI